MSSSPSVAPFTSQEIAEPTDAGRDRRDSDAKAEERREGAALIKATKPFDVEDPARTWLLFAQTLVVGVAAYAGALLLPWWPAQIAAAVVAGLTTVRVFIFYHDALHGAIFRESPIGMALMHLVGWFMLSPFSVWKETHDYHHQHNAKMIGASIGSYPTVTTKMWDKLTPNQRFWYRFARHPLTMLFGYATIFVGGMCISAFLREPKKHWAGPVALVFHFGIVAAVWLTLGAQAALIGIMLPSALSFAAGAYLFYAQHNFPSIDLRDRREWTYHHAALRSSSYFVMPALLHWFTGNIGYHHVHHLNHRIPFYRLPDAMASLPELQNPGRTSWAPTDMWACLRLKLWDPVQGRMVGWDRT